MKRLLSLPLLLTALVAVAFVVAQVARQQAEVDISVESVRAWVAGLGWKAPAVFTGLVALRLFFLVPSAVILTAGGLLFGPLLGTVFGGVGIICSAILAYVLARGIAGDWLRPRLGDKLEQAGALMERAGPLLVGGATAHPVGPMTLFHVGAGLFVIPVGIFLLAVAVGAPIRALLLSIFGSVLLEPTSWQFIGATSLVLVANFLPLAHPGLRRYILGRPSTDDKGA